MSGARIRVTVMWQHSFYTPLYRFYRCASYGVDADTRLWRGRSLSRSLVMPTISGSIPSEPAPAAKRWAIFPQAFTHIALIRAAFNLDRTLG